MANVGGCLVDVVNVSLSGICLASRALGDEGVSVKFVLYPRHGRSLSLNEGVHITGSIMGVSSEGVRIKFDRVTYSLVKLIIKHAGSQLGVVPFLVK